MRPQFYNEKEAVLEFGGTRESGVIHSRYTFWVINKTRSCEVAWHCPPKSFQGTQCWETSLPPRWGNLSFPSIVMKTKVWLSSPFSLSLFLFFKEDVKNSKIKVFIVRSYMLSFIMQRWFTKGHRKYSDSGLREQSAWGCRRCWPVTGICRSRSSSRSASQDIWTLCATWSIWVESRAHGQLSLYMN